MEENLVGDDLNETGCRGNEAGEKKYFFAAAAADYIGRDAVNKRYDIYAEAGGKRGCANPLEQVSEKAAAAMCLNIMRW